MNRIHINIPTTRRFINSIKKAWFLFLIALVGLFFLYIQLNSPELRVIDINLESAFMRNSSLDILVQLNHSENHGRDLISITYKGYTSDSIYRMPKYDENSIVFDFYEKEASRKNPQRSYPVYKNNFINHIEEKYIISPMITCILQSEETDHSQIIFQKYENVEQICFDLFSDSIIYDSCNNVQYKVITHKKNYSKGNILMPFSSETDKPKMYSIDLDASGSFFTNITGTILTKLNVKCMRHVPIINSVDNMLNDTITRQDRWAGRMDNEFYEQYNLSKVFIYFEYPNTPLSISSIYPQPDRIDSNGFMYDNVESVRDVLNNGIFLNAENIQQKSIVEKLNFIIASLIGVFSSLLVEIAYKKHTERKKKKKKVVIKGFRS